MNRRPGRRPEKDSLKKWQKGLDKYIGVRYTQVTIYREAIQRERIYRVTMEMRTMNNDFALTESTYYILLSLYEPQHGYGIMQRTEELSGGRVRLAAGTLYGALSSMSEKGWIQLLPGESGGRKKEYCLTAQGLLALKNELDRLKELVDNGEKVLGGDDNG